MQCREQALRGHFDYATASPPFVQALRVQSRAAGRYVGNPAALRGPGQAARQALERYRTELASLCGLRDGRVILAATLAATCRRDNILLHVDGAGAMGHVPVDLSAIGCDFYVFAGHTFGGPRGCGGVFVSAAPEPEAVHELVEAMVNTVRCQRAAGWGAAYRERLAPAAAAFIRGVRAIPPASARPEYASSPRN